MYLPSKPDKYGLKIISICDARTFYFLSGIPYVGREQKKMKTDLSILTQYVLRLTESIAGTNRNVTCDNWFASFELAEELSKKKLTLVGTVRQKISARHLLLCCYQLHLVLQSSFTKIIK